MSIHSLTIVPTAVGKKVIVIYFKAMNESIPVSQSVSQSVEVTQVETDFTEYAEKWRYMLL
jgi:hypothetical protein